LLKRNYRTKHAIGIGWELLVPLLGYVYVCTTHRTTRKANI